MRYVIELIDGFTFEAMETSEMAIKHWRFACIYEQEERWPASRKKPLIKIAGENDEEALKGLALWFAQEGKSA